MTREQMIEIVDAGIGEKIISVEEFESIQDEIGYDLFKIKFTIREGLLNPKKKFTLYCSIPVDKKVKFYLICDKTTFDHYAAIKKMEELKLI